MQYAHYGINGFHLAGSKYYGGDSLYPAKLTQISRPGRAISVLDSINSISVVPQKGNSLCRDNSSASFPHARHNGGINILWADCHVLRIKIHGSHLSYLTYMNAFGYGTTHNNAEGENYWKR